MHFRIKPQDAKDRFLVLAKQDSYTRAFIYHEIKRLSVQKGIDWSPAVVSQAAIFAAAWKVMAKEVEAERYLGEERKFKLGHEGVRQTGYDQLSDSKYAKLRGKERMWGIEERKNLQGMRWEGLGSGVVRPDGGELGSQMGTDVQGVRVKASEKKKGWFW
jgi:hypothetical protein